MGLYIIPIATIIQNPIKCLQTRATTKMVSRRKKQSCRPRRDLGKDSHCTSSVAIERGGKAPV